MAIQKEGGLIFRPAVREDTEVLLTFIRLLASHEGRPDAAIVTAENLQNLLFSDAAVAQAFMLENETKAIGYAMVTLKISSFSGHRILYIEDIYVDSNLRGDGSGQFIMHKLAEHASELKCKAIEWSAVSDNSSAESFYKKLGADLVTSHVHYTMTTAALLGREEQ